jgi:signal transduction histidine kinase
MGSLVSQEELETVLEQALCALVSARCMRAYKHEVRNGLQGVYGGVDALIRHARAKGPTHLSLDRTIEFVREAVRKHETSLDNMVGYLAGGEDIAGPVALAPLLSELTVFLSNDAARHGIRFKETLASDVMVRAHPRKLRMILLGLITDSIDAVSGGAEVHLSALTHEGHGQIEIADTRTRPEPVLDPWALDLTCESLRKGILMHVTRAIVTAQGGQIDCEYRDTGGGRAVRLRLPLA